jgi:hypothetical protein
MNVVNGRVNVFQVFLKTKPGQTVLPGGAHFLTVLNTRPAGDAKVRLVFGVTNRIQRNLSNVPFHAARAA